MGTTWPAAWPALAIDKISASPLDPSAASLRLFCRSNPTNPLVTSERRNVLPCRLGSKGRVNGVAQVRRQLMHRAGHLFFLHRIIFGPLVHPGQGPNLTRDTLSDPRVGV